MITSEDFSTLDLEIGEFLAGQAREASLETEAVRLAGRCLSAAVRNGHVCLSLENPGFTELEEKISFPAPGEWRELLLRSGVAGTPGEVKPLILDEESRLYFHRYFQYEQRLAAELRRKSAGAGKSLVWQPAMNDYFRSEESVDWQKVAAFVGLNSSFSVITGGPGTGKTWTMVRLLAVLLEGNPQLRVALAAPTGRAAARVRESVAVARAGLRDSIARAIPDDATTIHRLLGVIPGSNRFHFNSENPLPHDTVVIDEASMVDLPLMWRLVDALRREAKLVLVGDGDQLASVQAGSVLSDLCLRRNMFTAEFCAAARKVGVTLPLDASANGALANCVVELQTNQRFDRGSSLQIFCAETRRGRADEAITQCTLPDSNLKLVETGDHDELEKLLRDYARNWIIPWFEAAGSADALTRMNRSRILCAHRNGPHGVSGVNQQCEQILNRLQCISSPAALYYPGKPVMVTSNDYQQGLFNGDAGLIVPADEAGPGSVRALFGTSAANLRYVHPAQLPPHETAYAITVHKSQGSEFDHVVLILPEAESRVLSRELVYTAVSRARKSVEIWGTRDVLKTAITREVRRFSGLSGRLKA